MHATLAARWGFPASGGTLRTLRFDVVETPSNNLSQLGTSRIRKVFAPGSVDLCLLPEMDISLPRVLSYCMHLMKTKGHVGILRVGPHQRISEIFSWHCYILLHWEAGEICRTLQDNPFKARLQLEFDGNLNVALSKAVIVVAEGCGDTLLKSSGERDLAATPWWPRMPCRIVSPMGHPTEIQVMQAAIKNSQMLAHGCEIRSCPMPRGGNLHVDLGVSFARIGRGLYVGPCSKHQCHQKVRFLVAC